MAARGLKLVYGGGGIGLMGACAHAAHDAGGSVLGVIPEFLVPKEMPPPGVEHHIVDTMHERKLAMFEHADAFFALPGGIGTLEEAIETLSWRRLDLHAKPVVFLDRAYWAPLDALMSHMRTQGFLPQLKAPMYHLADTAEEALALVEQELGCNQ